MQKENEQGANSKNGMEKMSIQWSNSVGLQWRDNVYTYCVPHFNLEDTCMSSTLEQSKHTPGFYGVSECLYTIRT